MSQNQQFLPIGKTSYIATSDRRLPKYVVKIEVYEMDETETEIVMRSQARTQYVVYESNDNVLQKAYQLLYQISAQLGERAEKF